MRAFLFWFTQRVAPLPTQETGFLFAHLDATQDE
jgi:hypothetical protein